MIKATYAPIARFTMLRILTAVAVAISTIEIISSRKYFSKWKLIDTFRFLTYGIMLRLCQLGHWLMQVEWKV